MGHFRKTCCTVFPTNACNLACKYCLASHNDDNRPPDQNIDINFAKKGIQDYFSHGYTALRLYSSGEPLLCLDICHESVDFAKSLVGDQLSVEAQSNGVYDDAQLQFANDHIDILWVSLDGFPEVNDELRPDKDGKGTTRQVLNTIENLQKEEKTFIGIRATLTEDTMFRSEERRVGKEC